MIRPDLLRIVRSCAKWRVGFLLVAFLSLSIVAAAGPPDLASPRRMRWHVVAVGDTIIVRLAYTAGQRATGALWTVRVTATNGTWAGLPSRTPATATLATMIVSAIPWDSASFTPCLWGTRGAVVSKDSTCGPTLRLVRPPGPPTLPTWDTSATVIGLWVKPDTLLFTSLVPRQTCVFVQFQDGKVGQRTGDRTTCDSIYTRFYSVAQRAVTLQQQRCTDTTAYCHNPGSGLQHRWLNDVRLAVQ